MDGQGNSQIGSIDALSSLLADVAGLMGPAQSSGGQPASSQSPNDASSLTPATPSQDQFSSQGQNPMQALGLILEGLGELLSMLDGQNGLNGSTGQNGQNGSQGSGVAEPLGGNGNPLFEQVQSGDGGPASGNTGDRNGSGFHFAVPGFSYQDGGKNGGFAVNTPGLSFGDN